VYFRSTRSRWSHTRVGIRRPTQPRSGARAAATDSEIAALEKRLGTSLPPCFVSFLRYSNGYALFNYPEVIFGTEEIEWFVTHNKEYADIWNEACREVDDEMYAQYGAHQNPVHVRAEYLYSSLQISDVIDGYVYLLNPKIVNPNGDWEAWDFGSKIPGAIRYRSFWEMMRARSERILGGAGT
jgi:SMI1 / KNR4 family (SUKH-1)